MPETTPHPNGELRNPDVSYERRDVKPISLVKWVFALALGGIAVHLLIWWQFVYYLRNAEETYEGPVSPLLSKTEQERTGGGALAGGGAVLPPPPRLEALPPVAPPTVAHPEPPGGRRGIRAELEAEAARLRRYEWADEKKQIVRIPIERAMELALENEALRQKYLPRMERPREPGSGRKQGGRERPSDAGRKPEGARP